MVKKTHSPRLVLDQAALGLGSLLTQTPACLDIEFSNYDMYKKAIEAIKPFSDKIGILGEFKKGRKIL